MATEKLGVDTLRKIVKSAGQVGTVVSKLINKQGLFVLLQLQEPLAVLAGVDYELAKEEIKDLTSDERVVLETDLKNEFKPVNAQVDVVVDQFIDLSEKSVALIEEGIREGKEIYETVKDVVEEWKKLLGA